jgi:4a-hydroxytetrahydrobiopterin dehydratase
MRAARVQELLPQVPGWVLDGTLIHQRFRFKNFVEALAFVNAVGALAEAEGHHPDIHLSWNRVHLELTTHAIKGLSENDFILAAKINEIVKRET